MTPVPAAAGRNTRSAVVDKIYRQSPGSDYLDYGLKIFP